MPSDKGSVKGILICNDWCLRHIVCPAQITQESVLMRVTSSPSRETSALQKISRSSILRILSKTFLLTPLSECIPWPEERPDLGKLPAPASLTCRDTDANLASQTPSVRPLHWPPRAAKTEHGRLGGCTSKAKASAGLASGEASLPALQTFTFWLDPHMAFPLCARGKRVISALLFW